MTWAAFPTRLGWIGLETTPLGVRRVILPQPRREDVIARGAFAGRPRGGGLRKRLERYFEGQEISFPDALDLAGATPFQRAVWEATRAIPRGETRSYAWLAERIGRPRAARAVGQALGANPVPIVVPCHRVVASDGGLGGFGGGLALKQRLLDLERRTATGVTATPNE